jgi:3-dehydroquinate dehydratase / shikimate dehydrogenase
MKICLSIAPSSVQSARDQLARADSFADLVEIRIDGLSNLNFNKLLEKPRPPVIVTNRIISEGGKFRGSETEQFAILSEAANLGADYIDVEWKWGKAFIKRLKNKTHHSKLIVSYHNFEKTPDNLQDIYQEMLSAKPDILKIVAQARSIADNKKIFELLARAKADKQPVAAFCMGEHGQISRILAKKFGGALIYASPDESNITAPGQICIDDLKNVFRVHSLNKTTRVFGLVGNPVKQSKGRFYHNAIFQKNGVNAVYVNFLTDNLKEFIIEYRDLYRGISVTMPFKKEIVPMLDELHDGASALQVVNTVIQKKNKLIGYNTDYTAIEMLLRKIKRFKNKRSVIIGTGGVAKTMAAAALSLGSRTTIVGRSQEKARRLANELGCEYALLNDLPSLHCDILMNGTPVGMHSFTETMLVPPDYLRKNMIVFDAVYSPEMTPLVQHALDLGCKVFTGVQFFKQQAKLQSQLFLSSI